jgi:hypothetical protein
MRLVTIVCAALLATGVAHAQENPFLGTWNVSGDSNYVGWLEVKEEGGKLSAMYLNRGGSPIPGQDVKIADGELSFLLPARGEWKPAVRLRASGAQLTGSLATAKEPIAITAVRPPKWGACDANAKHGFGKAVTLFDGKSLDAWDPHHKERPLNWSVEDGVMTNTPKANNLVSKEKFKDFRIDAEYKLSEKGNSGIYLRGRYELQVLDDFGRDSDRVHGHMAIYARRPPDVNASKPAGEWQTMQATIVGNCLTVTLNGKTLHNNVRIPAITGGALDVREEEPGPIMIQGDHEKVWFRKVIVTPITSAGKPTE